MKLYSLIILGLGLLLFSSFTTREHWTAPSQPWSVLDTIKESALEFEGNENLEAVQEEAVELVSEETLASYYHDKFTGKKTASGAIFDNSKYTAAHKTLPFGTKVRVTNLKNKKSVVLTITDRGPFTKGREIDLSKKAFMEITEHQGRGILDVKIERIEG